jgi:hypothetical protein
MQMRTLTSRMQLLAFGLVEQFTRFARGLAGSTPPIDWPALTVDGMYR